MKFTMSAFAAVLMLAASTAIAQPSPAPQASVAKLPVAPSRPLDTRDFATVKADALKNIEGAIGRLNKDRKCVSAAKDPEQLLECRRASVAAQREAMEAMRSRAGAPEGPRMGPGGPQGPGMHPMHAPGPRPGARAEAPVESTRK